MNKYVWQTQEVTIQDLLNEKVEEEMKLSRCHLTVQIMRIITPQGGQTGNAYTRYQRGAGQQKINFHRILLCRSKSTLCYLMITNDMNKRLFNRDILLRDNGTITVGTYMRVLAPYPITRKMKDIPLVNSFYPAIVIERPSRVYTVPVNTYIQANQSGVAVLKDVILSVQRTTPIQTTCSGKHCDKARPLDWCNTINQGCGCYGTSSLGTCNIALMHDIVIEYRGSKIKESNFSSTKFNRLFMDKPLPPNTMVSALEQTEATEKLEIAIDKCLDEINENDGFEVVLWYSRGEINDTSLVGLNVQESEGQVSSGKMTYHTVEIRPMNDDYTEMGCLTSVKGKRLQEMKFKISDNF